MSYRPSIYIPNLQISQGETLTTLALYLSNENHPYLHVSITKEVFLFSGYRSPWSSSLKCFLTEGHKTLSVQERKAQGPLPCSVSRLTMQQDSIIFCSRRERASTPTAPSPFKNVLPISSTLRQLTNNVSSSQRKKNSPASFYQPDGSESKVSSAVSLQ